MTALPQCDQFGRFVSFSATFESRKFANLLYFLTKKDIHDKAAGVAQRFNKHVEKIGRRNKVTEVAQKAPLLVFFENIGRLSTQSIRSRWLRTIPSV